MKLTTPILNKLLYPLEVEQFIQLCHEAYIEAGEEQYNTLAYKSRVKLRKMIEVQRKPRTDFDIDVVRLLSHSQSGIGIHKLGNLLRVNDMYELHQMMRKLVDSKVVFENIPLNEAFAIGKIIYTLSKHHRKWLS